MRTGATCFFIYAAPDHLSTECGMNPMMGPMGYREERIAKNEVTSRMINEGIEEAYESEPLGASTFIICECGLERCDQLITITKAEYERVRNDPRQFVIVREHLIPDVEQVVFEGDRFLVVRKREGTPAQVATRSDPRS